MLKAINLGWLIGIIIVIILAFSKENAPLMYFITGLVVGQSFQILFNFFADEKYEKR